MKYLSDRFVFFKKIFAASFIILIPIVVYMPLADPSSSAKIFFIRIFCLLFIALYVLNNSLPVESKKIWLSVSALFLASFLPALYAKDLYLAIVGIYPFFASSLLASLSCIVIFLFYSNLDRTTSFLVTKSIYIVLSLLSLYALLQYFDRDFLSWSGNFMPRVFSTFGNPNFFASFIVIILPYLFADYIRKGEKYHLFIFLLALVSLLLTGSRAGLLGAVISLIVFLILIEKSKIFTKRLVFLFIGIVFVVFALLLQNKHEVQYSLDRYMQIIDLSDANIAARLEQYKAAAKMFMDKPLFGNGTNAYYINFRNYVSKDFFNFTDFMSVPGYPHNIILRWLLERGLFLFVLSAFAWIMIIKELHENKKKYYSVSAISSLSSYFVVNMFGFTIIPVSVLFWALLGNSFSDEHLKCSKRNLGVYKCFILLLLLLILRFSVREFKADISFKKADFIKASSLAPNNLHYLLTLGKAYYLDNNSIMAEEVFKDAIIQSPYSALAYNALATIYMDRKELDRAIEYFQFALEKDPYLLDSHLKLANIYRNQEQFDKAEMKYRKILELNPENVDVNYDLGVIYYKRGNLSEASVQWKKVLDLEPDHIQAKKALKIIE